MKLPRVFIKHLIFNRAGKAYKDSDYTVVIATMQLDKRIIIVLKLTLVVEIEALLSCRQPPLLDRSPTSGGSTVLRKVLTTRP